MDADTGRSLEMIFTLFIKKWGEWGSKKGKTLQEILLGEGYPGTVEERLGEVEKLPVDVLDFVH